jgi:hypothetical protein
MTISSRPHNKARLSTMELFILVVSAFGPLQHLFPHRLVQLLSSSSLSLWMTFCIACMRLPLVSGLGASERTRLIRYIDTAALIYGRSWLAVPLVWYTG